MGKLTGTIGKEGLRFTAERTADGKLITVVLLSATGKHVDSAAVKPTDFFSWLEERQQW